MTDQEIESEMISNDLDLQERNCLSHEVRTQLRKFQYPFPKSQEYLANFERANEDATTRPIIEASLINAIAEKERKHVCKEVDFF